MSPATKNWELPLCPICHTASYLNSFYQGVTTWEFPGKFNYVKCSRCQLVFQSPRETPAVSQKYYQSETYWGRDINKDFTFIDSPIERQKHYGPIYKEIFSRKNRGSILDIGSGLGLFLSLFKEKHWEVLGTETSSAVANFSQKTFSVPVKVGDLLMLHLPPLRYDVVSLIGVFEHVYTPNSTLEEIYRLLKPGGLLVVVPPNISSLGHLIFQSHWNSLEPGRHLYHYSPATITQLLHQHGFIVSAIKHHHWEYNYYSLFNTCRLIFSPRFRRLSTPQQIQAAKLRSSPASIAGQLGKFAAQVFASTISLLEPILGRGESMIVIAQKPL